MKNFFTLTLCFLTLSLTAQYSLIVESSEALFVPGNTVYRFYVNMAYASDKLSAVFGNDQDNLIINTPAGIFNSPDNYCNINPAFWPLFPEIQDDSYISIGDIPCGDSDGYVCQELIDYFTIGGTSLLINTLIGCAVGNLNLDENNYQIDGRVFFMQITTSGSISGTLNYQVFPLGVGADQVQISVDFDGAGTFCDGTIENACGCMDDTACNYDPSAEYDDESCIYAEVLYDCNGDCINDANSDGICDLPCPEDLDYDGYITIQDLLLILSDFGCDTACENDITQDGYVAVDDLLLVLSEFGNSCEIFSFQNCGDLVAHEGYEYSTVQIGDQCWFSENCRYLPQVSPSTIVNATTPYYYVYGFEDTNVEVAKATENYEAYGVLYNWPAVMTEGICPTSWHMPSDEEWQNLEISLGMSESIAMELGFRGTDEGAQMKSISGWFNNGNGTNTSGFNSKPGGLLPGIGFYGLELHGFWWTSTVTESNYLARQLVFGDDTISRQYEDPIVGFSARCVKD